MVACHEVGSWRGGGGSNLQGLFSEVSAIFWLSGKVAGSLKLLIGFFLHPRSRSNDVR